MYYLLIDSDGVSLDTFSELDEAIQAWEGLVQSDRAAASEVAVLECEDDGTALADVTPGTQPAGMLPFPA